MRAAFVIASVFMLAACAQTGTAPSPSAPAASALVTLGGDGEFVETQRDAAGSTVEVRKSPSGSVAAALYALRGSCAVLRARAAPFVKSERLVGAVPTYRLTFPAAPGPEETSGAAKRVFSSADCTALRF